MKSYENSKPESGLVVFASRLGDYSFKAGMWWVVMMMLLTTCDVITRFCFSLPIPGSKELCEFMLCIFIVCGLIYTQQAEGNVRVTLLEKFLSRRAKAVLAVFYNLSSFGIMIVLAWKAWIIGIEEFHAGTTSDSLSIPVYPFKLLLSLGVFLLCFQLFVSTIESLKKV